MKAAHRISILGAFLMLGSLHAGTSPSLKLVQEIPLPQVKGRIDHMAIDIFCDAARKRVCVACGAGFLDVIEQKDASNYVPSERILTAPGARTSLFVPESSVLDLAVPIQKDRDAAIYV